MIQEPNCRKRGCRHFLGVRYTEKGKEESEIVYCAAYPNGIPNDIAYGDDKHLEVRDDQDNNITFEEEG